MSVARARQVLGEPLAARVLERGRNAPPLTEQQKRELAEVFRSAERRTTAKPA